MANKDLEFLQEMKALTASLLKDSYDIIKVQHLDQMVTDWIDEVKNNDCIADVVKSLPNKYCPQCGEPVAKPHKFWCEIKP